MNEQRNEFLDATMKCARKQYDEKFAAIESATYARVSEYFTNIQKEFQKNGAFPSNAYARSFSMEWSPDTYETYILRKMGFLVGKQECHEYYEDREPCAYTTVPLAIPDTQSETETTTAQQLYAEHVKKINEILEEKLQAGSEFLKKEPDAWSIAENFLNSIREGEFESKIIGHNPDKLQMSMKVQLEGAKTERYGKYYEWSYRFHPSKLGTALANYVLNRLCSEGMLEENGVCKLQVRVRHENSGKYLEATMEVNLPKVE